MLYILLAYLVIGILTAEYAMYRVRKDDIWDLTDPDDLETRATAHEHPALVYLAILSLWPFPLFTFLKTLLLGDGR